MGDDEKMIGNLYRIIDNSHLHFIAKEISEESALKIIIEVLQPDTMEYEQNCFSKDTTVFHVITIDHQITSYMLTKLPISADILVYPV